MGVGLRGARACVWQKLLGDTRNRKRHTAITEGSLEVEDFTPPESPKVNISVVEDHTGFELLPQ